MSQQRRAGRLVQGLVMGGILVVASTVSSRETLAEDSQAAPVAVDKSPGVLVRAGKRELLEYRYEKVPFKPYVKRLCSPSGAQVLLDAPSDHLHHHGLMFAIAAGGVDFWSETPACGKQVNRSIEVVQPDAKAQSATAGFAEQLDWLAPGGKVVLQERRTVRAGLAADANATLVTWRTRLSCPAGTDSVKLHGDHYFGLGLRFVRSMDKAGTFRTPKGAPEKIGTRVRGTEYNTPADWCAYAAKADGKLVTVAMFGRPEIKPFPVTWFTMTDGFAYLSATLNLWKKPFAIAADKPLELCYGVAVWDGRPDDEAIEKLFKQWLGWTAEGAQ